MENDFLETTEWGLNSWGDIHVPSENAWFLSVITEQLFISPLIEMIWILDCPATLSIVSHFRASVNIVSSSSLFTKKIFILQDPLQKLQRFS